MATFVHHQATETGAGVGWLAVFLSDANWRQVSFGPELWMVQAVAGSGYEGWTFIFRPKETFIANASGELPAGAIGSIEVRSADGALVATITGLGDLNLPVQSLRAGQEQLFSGNDSFIGSGGGDRFNAGGGSDTLQGMGDNDTLDGGGGVDTLFGGNGDDLLTTLGGAVHGDLGLDTFQRIGTANVSLSGVEIINGSSGDELFKSDYDVKYISAGYGRDVVVFGLNLVSVDGGGFRDSSEFVGSAISGSTTVRRVYDESKDLLDFSEVAKSINYNSDSASVVIENKSISVFGFESVKGTKFDDVIIGYKYGVFLTSYNSYNYFSSSSSSGTTYGYTQSGTISGDSGNDTLVASNLTSGFYGDTLSGGTGDDSLVAGSDQNTTTNNLSGDEGNDTLIGGRQDIIDGGSGNDSILGNLGSNLISGGIGNDTFSSVGNSSILGGDGADLVLSNGSGAAIDGGTGNDSLMASGGATLSGGSGDDVLTPGLGNDLLNGGSGFDIVDYTSNLAGLSITLGLSSAQVDGYGSFDTLVEIEGIIGGRFSDTISSVLSGGVYLSGGAGNDLLSAGSGADVLQGGIGNDTLAGGAGADKFVTTLDGSIDRFADFTSGTDFLVLFTDGGAIASGSSSVLTWRQATGVLSWDVDGDMGQAAPVTFAIAPTATDFRASDLAAGFHPGFIRKIHSNGSMNEVRFDWSGQAPWSQTETAFDPQGRMITYFVANDDGSSWTRWYDNDASRSWRLTSAEYDPQGRITAYSALYDDESWTTFSFDTANTQTWTRNYEQYDALGRLASQSVAWDDGKASERYIDTYDVHPWAFQLDGYVDGTLVSRNYYNADGSPFG